MNLVRNDVLYSPPILFIRNLHKISQLYKIKKYCVQRISNYFKNMYFGATL